MELTRKESFAVSYFSINVWHISSYPGYLPRVSYILPWSNFFLLIGHVCEPSTNISAEHYVLSVPVNYSNIFMHETDKCFFQSLTKENYLWSVSLPGYGISFLWADCTVSFSFLLSMHYLYYWLLPKSKWINHIFTTTEVFSELVIFTIQKGFFCD